MASRKLEQGAALVLAALEEQIVGQPEAAGEERALATGQPVDLAEAVTAVAADEAVVALLAPDGGHGADHARVTSGQEPDQGDEQEPGVESRASS